VSLESHITERFDLNGHQATVVHGDLATSYLFSLDNRGKIITAAQVTYRQAEAWALGFQAGYDAATADGDTNNEPQEER
jgi:hypothetical protein